MTSHVCSVMGDDMLQQAGIKSDQLLSCIQPVAMHSTAAHNKDMSTSSAESANLIQQFVKQ